MLNITSSTSRHWTARKLIDAWGAYGTGAAKLDNTVNPVSFVCSKFDSLGNVITVGSKLTDPDLVCSTGPITDESIVVAKYDSKGTPLWQKNISGTGLVAIFANYLAIDADDNIYVVCNYLNESILPNVGDDIALIKLNSSGSVVFTKPIHIDYGLPGSYGNMVAATDGLIFSYSWNTVDAFSEREIVISKYDFSGNLMWSFVRDTPSTTERYVSHRIFLSNATSDFFFVGVKDVSLSGGTVIVVDRYQEPIAPAISPTLSYSKSINTTYTNVAINSQGFSIDSNDNFYFSIDALDINSKVLIKVDSLGNLQSARTYNLPVFNYAIGSYRGFDCSYFQNELYFIGDINETDIGNDFDKNYICKYNSITDTFTSLVVITSATGSLSNGGSGGSGEKLSDVNMNSLTFCGLNRSPVGDQGLLFKITSSLEAITDDFYVSGAPGWSLTSITPPTIGTTVISSFSVVTNSLSAGSPTITSPAATFSSSESTVSKTSPGNFVKILPYAPLDPLYPTSVLFKVMDSSQINAVSQYNTWATVETVDCGGPTLFGIVSAPVVNDGQQQFTMYLRGVGTRYGGPVLDNIPNFGTSNVTVFTTPWGNSTYTWDGTPGTIQDISAINDPIISGAYSYVYRTKDSPTHYTLKTYPTSCAVGGIPTGEVTAVECKGEEFAYTTIDGNKIPDVSWTNEWEFTLTTTRDSAYLLAAGFSIPPERIGTAPGAAQVKYTFQNISWCDAGLGYYANYIFDSILVYPIAVVASRKTVPGTNLTIRSNVYEGGQYMMAASQGTMFTSPDSNTWTQQTNVAGITDSLRSIAYGNGTYVVVGSAGKIVTSTDGTTWTARTSGTTSALNRVGFGNSVFLAVGRANTILRSTNNGTSWSFVTVTGTYRGIAYNSATSTWVAVGDTGAILTSTNDGVSWTTRTSGTSSQLWSVSVINGVYYAVGQNGTIIKSNDAITWSSNLNDSGNSGFLNYISYGNGVYIVSGDAAIILQSNTGTNGWYQLPSPAAVDLHSVLFRNDQFNIAGSPSSGSSVLLGTNDIV